MSHTLEYISSHPKIAFCIMSFHLIGTFVIKDFQFPVIIMQVFQIFAWTITGVVGSITIYKFLTEKRVGNRKKK